VSKVKIPRDLQGRVKDAARDHKFDSADVFAEHILERGLKNYDLPNPDAKLQKRMKWVVEEHGYSSLEELIEHLLLRGLKAYEAAETDPHKLEERLRGLGYID